MKNNLNNRQKPWFVAGAVALIALCTVSAFHQRLATQMPDFALGALTGICLGVEIAAFVVVAGLRSKRCM
jgi:hypothetical protein